MTFKDLADKAQHRFGTKIMIARVGNQYHELSDEYNGEENVEFLDMTSSEGMAAYKKSMLFVMLKAFHDLYHDTNVQVMFALGPATYIEADMDITNDVIEAVRAKMTEIINKNYVFQKETISTTKAIAHFKEYGMAAKAKAFEYRRTSTTNVYKLGQFENYFYGDLVYSTNYLSVFDVRKYKDGFVLICPEAANPTEITFNGVYDKLYERLKTTSTWAHNLNINSAGALNDVIVNRKMSELILLQEAVMESQMTVIAREVITRGKKAVFIAGPSSSGKTTSSNRLSVQLKTHGYNAHPIACDDYFHNREDVPYDENGKQNFEAISVLDLATLEADVLNLLAGKTVALPKFNFVTGKREYTGKTLTLGENDILVIEGIHCLNPQFLPNVDAYRMYVSALPVLNLDGHNYISSSNSRLLRRIARDASHRGASAQKTISMWESVRAGEEENIFPYQENADVIFNSSLIYELPVLKTVAEPLLFAVDRNSEEWATAKTLLKFLDFFLGYPGNEVPTNSVLREFMGGSCFDVG